MTCPGIAKHIDRRSSDRELRALRRFYQRVRAAADMAVMRVTDRARVILITSRSFGARDCAAGGEAWLGTTSEELAMSLDASGLRTRRRAVVLRATRTRPRVPRRYCYLLDADDDLAAGVRPPHALVARQVVTARCSRRRSATATSTPWFARRAAAAPGCCCSTA